MRFSIVWIFGAFVIVSLVATTASSSQDGRKNESNTTQQQNKHNKLWNGLHFVSSFIVGHKAGTYNQENLGLQVLGAGFSRTGTKSLEAALLQLGHRIYDTSSIMQHKHVDRWLEAAREWKATGTSPTAQALVEEIEAEGYTATLDFPINLFAIMLKEMRPQAKVIFGVRDSVQSWVDAWRQISYLMGFLMCRPWNFVVPTASFYAVHDIAETLQPPLQWPKATVCERHLPWYENLIQIPGLDGEEQQWIEMHHNYEKQLVEAIPEHDFLKFNVKQGWAPLVDFLKLDPALAAQPFPNINDRQTLKTVRKIVDLLAIGLPLWLCVFLYIQYCVVRWGIGLFNRPTKSKLA